MDAPSCGENANGASINSTPAKERYVALRRAKKTISPLTPRCKALPRAYPDFLVAGAAALALRGALEARAAEINFNRAKSKAEQR